MNGGSDHVLSNAIPAGMGVNVTSSNHISSSALLQNSDNLTSPDAYTTHAPPSLYFVQTPLHPVDNFSSFTSLLFTSVSDDGGDFAGVNSTATAEYPVDVRYATLQTVLLGMLAGSISLITITGNLVVIASFILERSIRQPTNYFIASLAVSDLLIGSVSMPFYTIYLLSGKYWPLGEVLCDLWLSLDYTVCLVSIYTVFCITIDRFCSVKIPAKYRNWRTERKVLVVVCVTWLVPILVFFTSINGWQYFVGRRTVPPGMCYVQYMEDAIFNMLLQFGYFWITLTVMCSLYAGIYRVALRLQQKSEAKQRKMASLVSVAGSAMSKIGIGMTQPPPQQHHNQTPSDHQRSQPQQVQPHSNGNSYRGGGNVADVARSTPSKNRPAPLEGNVSSEQKQHRPMTPIDRLVAAEAVSRAPASTPRQQHQLHSKSHKSNQQQQQHHLRKAISPPEKSSSSSMALSSDSDGADEVCRSARQKARDVAAASVKQEQVTSKKRQPVSNRRFRGPGYVTNRPSPVEAVEKAVQFVNAARKQAKPAVRNCPASEGELVKYVRVDRQCNRIAPVDSAGLHSKTEVRRQSPKTDSAGGYFTTFEQRCTIDPTFHVSGTSFEQDSIAGNTECTKGISMEEAFACYTSDDELKGSIFSRGSAQRVSEPVWEYRGQAENFTRTISRQPPSPVWVRRAVSQNVVSQRSPSPPLRPDCGSTSGFSCDWATCRGGISGIQRRKRRYLTRSADYSFALRRTKTVEFEVEKENRPTSSDFDRTLSSCTGNFSTSLIAFDFRSTFTDCYGGRNPTECRQFQQQQQRNRSHHSNFTQPSRFRRSFKANDHDEEQNLNSRQRKRFKPTVFEESQRHRKLKRIQKSINDECKVTHRESITDPNGITSKSFFLTAAAAALQRRMVGSSFSRAFSRQHENRANEDDINAEGRSRSSARSSTSKTENRALKALRTITIILGAFVLCFTPWHVLSLIMGFCGDDNCVSTTLYDISYWLCYLNSPLNPFCYAFANQQFKKTFLRIIRLDWHRT